MGKESEKINLEINICVSQVCVFPVADFPGKRLEFSIRVSLWTRGRDEVPGEKTKGQSSPCWQCVCVLIRLRPTQWVGSELAGKIGIFSLYVRFLYVRLCSARLKIFLFF